MPRGGARENTGGAREGSGRKKTASLWSDAFKSGLVRAMKKMRRETGLTMQEVMLSLFRAPETSTRDRIHIYKAVSDAMVEKISHKTVDETKRIIKPLLLPTMKEDPARLDMRKKPVPADEVKPPKVH